MEILSTLHKAPFASFKDIFAESFTSILYDCIAMNIEILDTVLIFISISSDQRISFHRLGSGCLNKFMYTIIEETVLLQNVNLLYAKLRRAVVDRL